MITLGIQAHLLNTVRKARRLEGAELASGPARLSPAAIVPPWLDRAPKRGQDADYVP
jgi:hypothetical protein